MTAAQALSPLMPTSPIADAAALAPIDRGRALFDLLREKWKEVPAGIYDRADTTRLLQLADWELRDYWDSVWSETSTGAGYATRGWYQDLYRDQFRGKRVLEIGSGCGVDGIHFIRNGATWYFADIVPSNLKLIRRILDSFGLDCEGMTYIEDLGCLDQIPDGFDFIYCNGSMINVPFQFSWIETLHLVSHLRPGGRWVELCYPRERWAREGGVPFSEWGKLTDGEATPWVEWYDLQRLRDRFAPVALKPVLAFNYYDDDYNWFDFRIDSVPDRQQVASYIDAGPAQRVPVSLSPSGFKRHGTTTIEPVTLGTKPALRVQTSPSFWSYAIHGSLDATVLQQAGLVTTEDTLPAIELTLTVQQGRVGVGLMAEDLVNFIGLEQHCPSRDEPHVVRIPCPPGRARYEIMLRNTQGGDVPSTFLLQQLVLTTVRKETTSSSDDVADAIPLTARLRLCMAPGEKQPTSELPVFVRSLPFNALDRVFGYEETTEAIGDENDLLDYIERNQRAASVVLSGGEGWAEATPGSIDIALVDGARGAGALQRDTARAIDLLRPRGMMIWRGFSAESKTLATYPEARAIACAIHDNWRAWAPSFLQIFWIADTNLLLGVKR